MAQSASSNLGNYLNRTVQLLSNAFRDHDTGAGHGYGITALRPLTAVNRGRSAEATLPDDIDEGPVWLLFGAFPSDHPTSADWPGSEKIRLRNICQDRKESSQVFHRCQPWRLLTAVNAQSPATRSNDSPLQGSAQSACANAMSTGRLRREGRESMVNDR